jgi:hypothetical protein
VGARDGFVDAVFGVLVRGCSSGLTAPTGLRLDMEIEPWRTESGDWAPRGAPSPGLSWFCDSTGVLGLFVEWPPLEREQVDEEGDTVGESLRF